MKTPTVHSWVLAASLLILGCSPSGAPDGGALEPGTPEVPATPEKRVIQPEGYRPTPSPLSPGILVGNTLYLSGSTGGDPLTGQLVPGGFEPEMRQVMANMTTVLAAAEMDLSNVVQVTTYLADMVDYARYNAIYREYFTVEPLPVRATVAVKELARGAVVEMMMVAVR
ncbi:MAG: Rid family hydrolase [Gemmatimonadota bacterium]